MSRPALGIDVGIAKGLDLVALKGSRVLHTEAGASLAGVEAAVRWLRPAVVAIDSPPGWSAAGRSRPIERQLMRLGINVFPTPALEFRRDLHRWMEVGFSVFESVRRLGYPLYAGEGPVAGHALEVFPHASAVALREGLPARRTPKSSWRRAVLEAAGLDTRGLPTIDQLDAALAALTGVRALAGEFTVVGGEGSVLVLPVTALPVRRYPRDG